METNAWAGDKVPVIATKAGAILIVAGAIEIIRISATIIFSAFSSQGAKGKGLTIQSFNNSDIVSQLFMIKPGVIEQHNSFAGS